MDEHCKRVLDVVTQGIGRPAQIVRKTCLGPDQVLTALKILRKQKILEKIDGEHRLVKRDGLQN